MHDSEADWDLCNDTDILGSTEELTADTGAWLSQLQQSVCAFLHSLFLEDSALLRLVHTQGYQSELLPLLFDRVPCMHSCTNFIEDLLKQQTLEGLIFAIQLASHLAIHYPLPPSLLAARAAIGVMHAKLQAAPSVRHLFFSATLPSLALMCQAFPPLLETSFDLLLKLRSVELAVSVVFAPSALDASISASLDRLSALVQDAPNMQ